MRIWVNGAEATAPAAATQLVKVVVSAGKLGKVYGFRVASQEVNAAGKVWRLRANVQGMALTIAAVDGVCPYIQPTFAPLFILKGNGVDFYEVVNAVAGAAGTLHQVSLLYEEEDCPPDRVRD